MEAVALGRCANAGAVTAKSFNTGTHRAVSPEETLLRVGEKLRLFGVTRVADITGLDRVGIPVMAAYRPDSWSLAVSMGKGITEAAARASAVMETIELWHAERPDIRRVWGSAAELERDHPVVDWRLLPPVAGRNFDQFTPTAWVEAVSLADRVPALVPYEVVHTDGRFPEPPGSGWFACTSNGLASGNTMAEAQVHALCEVIERDAVTLWRLRPNPADLLIDPGTVVDPVCRQLLDRLERSGLRVLLHDATTDIGAATVVCTLFEADSSPELFIYATTGAGTHPAPSVALSRALTEAAQSRLTLISGARDDTFRPGYAAPADAGSRYASLSRLHRASDGATRSFVGLPDLATDSIEGDLQAVLGALRHLDLHPYWVDLSQASVGIPVGRAVVPGLEHLSTIGRYRPGARARAALAGAVP